MAVLKDKVAIITGASSGIGEATTRLFARQGAKLVITGRRREKLQSLVDEIEAMGGQALFLTGDVREEAVAGALVEIAVHRFGGLDIAFNNAGAITEMAPLTDISTKGWREMLDVNLTSAYFGAKYQLPAMIERGGGSLIFTSSFVGYSAGFPGLAAYGAAKAGIIGLMQGLAVENGPKGIRVNAILPGATDTPMNIARAPDADPGLQSFIESLYALKRMASPEEIAQSVLHLASDASSFMTGVALLVDGGVSINRTRKVRSGFRDKSDAQAKSHIGPEKCVAVFGINPMRRHRVTSDPKSAKRFSG